MILRYVDDQLTSHEPAAGSHDQTEEQPPSDSDKQDVPTSDDGNTIDNNYFLWKY